MYFKEEGGAFWLLANRNKPHPPQCDIECRNTVFFLFKGSEEKERDTAKTCLWRNHEAPFATSQQEQDSLKETSPKQASGVGEGQGTTGEEEEKKKQKRGGRGQIKQKKKSVPQKVTIAKIPRAKKKYVTRVCGLATFEIDLKEAQRFFAQKFSCGASVTGEDEIIIQGDFTDDIIDVILEKWPEVDDENIDDLGEVKK
ncbi:density-regulated protein-like [Anolis carolinensis]|uniref:density-regulated protein-like n=1 Tax=Anolis carolinensis TaxID=28377 RepID=UPI002F2B7FBB